MEPAQGGNDLEGRSIAATAGMPRGSERAFPACYSRGPMKPGCRLVAGLLVGLLVGAAGVAGAQSSAAPSAQRRPYNLVMKDVASTSDALRRHLEAGNADAAVAEADKLARLFQETEDFWTPFRTRDAIEAAKGARELSAAVAAAVRAKDLPRARKEVAGLGRFCTTCHNSHREQMPDKTYRIRP
jgi:cytochrome c556